MPWKDDEDETYSVADHRYFEHADHGKKELREIKASEKGELLKLQRQVLRGQVDEHKSVEDANQEDASDEATKKEDQQKNAPKTFHTETLKEKEEKVQESSALPDAGDLAEMAQNEPEVPDVERNNESG